MSSPVTGTRFSDAASALSAPACSRHPADASSHDRAASSRNAADDTGPAEIFRRFEAAARFVDTPQTAFAFALPQPAPPARHPALNDDDEEGADEEGALAAPAFAMVMEQASSGCFAGLRDWFRELAAKIVSWWRDSDANREIRGTFQRVTDNQLAGIGDPERRDEIRALLNTLVDPSSGWPLDMRDVAAVVRKVRDEEIKIRLGSLMDGLDARLAQARHDAASLEADIGATANAPLPQETADMRGVRDDWQAGQRHLRIHLGKAAGIVRTDRLLVRKLPQSAYTERIVQDQLARAGAAIDRAEGIAVAFKARLAASKPPALAVTAIGAGDGDLSCAAALPESE